MSAFIPRVAALTPCNILSSLRIENGSAIALTLGLALRSCSCNEQCGCVIRGSRLECGELHPNTPHAERGGTRGALICGMRMVLFMALCGVVAMCLMGCATQGRERGGGGLRETGLLYRSLDVGGVERRYAVYVPREYRDGQAWPCIIFLNGSGECGEDGQRQLTQGLFPAMINAPTDWPFVVIFPQKPTRASTWADHDAYVMAALERTRREVSIDAGRIYLTGLSQGGAGTWAIGAKHADEFAAIAPVCGFGDAEVVGASLREMPIWAMHGEKDDVVPIAQSEKLVNAAAGQRTVELNPASGSSLKPGAKSPLRFTRFADLNHGCWDRAYRDMELGEWFLSFRR